MNTQLPCGGGYLLFRLWTTVFMLFGLFSMLWCWYLMCCWFCMWWWELLRVDWFDASDDVPDSSKWPESSSYANHIPSIRIMLIWILSFMNKKALNLPRRIVKSQLLLVFVCVVATDLHCDDSPFLFLIYYLVFQLVILKNNNKKKI